MKIKKSAAPIGVGDYSRCAARFWQSRTWLDRDFSTLETVQRPKHFHTPDFGAAFRKVVTK